LTPACGGLLEPRGLGLELPKCTFNAEKSICRLRLNIVLTEVTSNLSKAHEMHDSLWQFLFAGCPGLSPCISLQFTVEVCAATENCRKIPKNPYAEGSRLFKVINVESLKACQQLLLQ